MVVEGNALAVSYFFGLSVLHMSVHGNETFFDDPFGHATGVCESGGLDEFDEVDGLALDSECFGHLYPFVCHAIGKTCRYGA